MEIIILEMYKMIFSIIYFCAMVAYSTSQDFYSIFHCSALPPNLVYSQNKHRNPHFAMILYGKWLGIAYVHFSRIFAFLNTPTFNLISVKIFWDVWNLVEKTYSQATFDALSNHLPN